MQITIRTEMVDENKSIDYERTCKLNGVQIVVPSDIRNEHDLKHDDMIRVKFIGKVDVKEKLKEFR
jgi:hypothetical protein